MTKHAAGLQARMPDPATFDLPPRRALAAVSPEVRAAWRGRYCAGEGAELRVQALLERTERELRAASAETTIHMLWVTLANRVVIENTPDGRAAAALAGMAMGQVGVG